MSTPTPTSVDTRRLPCWMSPQTRQQIDRAIADKRAELALRRYERAKRQQRQAAHGEGGAA